MEITKDDSTFWLSSSNVIHDGNHVAYKRILSWMLSPRTRNGVCASPAMCISHVNDMEMFCAPICSILKRIPTPHCMLIRARRIHAPMRRSAGTETIAIKRSSDSWEIYLEMGDFGNFDIYTLSRFGPANQTRKGIGESFTVFERVNMSMQAIGSKGPMELGLVCDDFEVLRIWIQMASCSMRYESLPNPDTASVDCGSPSSQFFPPPSSFSTYILMPSSCANDSCRIRRRDIRLSAHP